MGLVKGSHHVSLFTVSRNDLHDYERCPKILSIKTHLMMHQPEVEPEPVQARERVGLSPQAIGKVGELTTEVSFTPAIPEARREVVVVDALAKLGLLVDERIRKLVEESLAGLDQIKPILEEEYGAVSIIGKGETRYGLAPTYGMPDYVAFASGRDKPILVEVKNTERQNSQDEFQASYYNTLQRTVGVVISDKRIEEGRTAIRPKVVLEKDAETIIIYPRLGDYIPVKETIDITPELIQSVWEAKQLGLIGKSPARECPAKCPHHRYGIELEEGSIDVAKPLSLIFAKGLTEKGIDLDFSYLRSFAWQNASPVMDTVFMLRNNMTSEKEGRLIDLLTDKLEISTHEAKRLVRRDMRPPTPEPKDIMREMASDMEAWEKLVGRKDAEVLAQKSYSLATRIYTLPKSSGEMIEKAWDKW
jgi:polyhydroxyalkanoate synthesis regulator phasin